ncbi:MAG: flavodoxin domain-containing protein [Actinomycetota bacterium]
MDDKVLVAYATRHGNTAEAAEHIAEFVRGKGLEVEVKPAAAVDSLEGYKAVILGTPVKGDKPMPDAVAFAQRFRTELDTLPTAIFGLSMMLTEPTEENKKSVISILNQLRYEMRPIGMGAFGGVREVKNLPFVLKWTAKRSKIPMGDFRDWEAMKEWAEQMAVLIKENRRY